MKAAADDRDTIARARKAVDEILLQHACDKSSVIHIGQLIEHVTLLACDAGASDEEAAFATALALGKLMRDIPALSEGLLDAARSMTLVPPR